VEQRIDLFLDLLPLSGFKSWAAVALLYKQGFSGTYSDYCRELGWLDDYKDNPQKSMVSRALRQAKQRGLIPENASLSKEAA
jgi:hypothetical protein